MKVKAAIDPDAHLAAKRAALIEQRRPQNYLLCDEAETRAVARWRRAPGDLQRQARDLLRWFKEV